jgi:hypothetical protein
LDTDDTLHAPLPDPNMLQSTQSFVSLPVGCKRPRDVRTYLFAAELWPKVRENHDFLKPTHTIHPSISGCGMRLVVILLSLASSLR